MQRFPGEKFPWKIINCSFLVLTDNLAQEGHWEYFYMLSGELFLSAE